MSYQASQFIGELRGVSCSEKCLLFILARFHNTRSGVSWPSLPHIAEEAGLTERQVIRILQALEVPRAGHPNGIICRFRAHGGRGAVIEYSFVGFQEKDDAGVTLSDEKRVTSAKKRVTSTTEKGDICDSAIRKDKFDELKAQVVIPDSVLRRNELERQSNLKEAERRGLLGRKGPDRAIG